MARVPSLRRSAQRALFGLALGVAGCGALSTDHQAHDLGVVVVLQEELTVTGRTASEWGDPGEGFTPINALAVDGARLLMARGTGLVALGPLARDRSLSASDQRVLFAKQSPVYSLHATGGCTVGGPDPWILPRAGTIPTPLFPGEPLAVDAGAFYWGLSMPSRGGERVRIMRLATAESCDPSTALLLGELPARPLALWVETDATSFYATVYEDGKNVTYRLPLTGGTATKLETLRPHPRYASDVESLSFGSLLFHVAPSPNVQRLERLTSAGREVLWTAGEDEEILAKADDAESLYFSTFTKACVEKSSCPNPKAPPGSGEGIACCKSDLVHFASRLYRVAKN